MRPASCARGSGSGSWRSERHDLARDLDGGWISTIHGFCHRLLRAHPFEAGLDPRFRVLDESQSAVLRSEAFAEALARYVETGGPERVRLLATYGAEGLRGMLTSVYDRLRSAGRPLELPGEPVSSLAARVAELSEVAEITLRVTEESLPGRAQVEDALQLLDPIPPAEDLLDLSDLRVGGEERERFASFGEALAAVEQAALDEIASRDRALLEEHAERVRRGLRRGEGSRVGTRLRRPAAARPRPFCS